MDETKIVGVAMRKGVVVCTLPAPNRHSDLISALNGIAIEPHTWEQGFIGDDGKFYTRFQAWQRAYRSEQTKVRRSPPELFSEDVW